MLEEHTMEKKNLSRLQPPTKGTATEVKKNPGKVIVLCDVIPSNSRVIMLLFESRLILW